MGLFGFDLVKEAGGWEAAMTEEEITEMEKKGYDMSSVRCKQAEIAAQEEAAEAAFMEQRKATAVPTDLNKLTSYRSTPRSTESEFFKDVAGKAPLFGKDKWREKFATAPLLYGAVVQANSGLWLPGREDDLPAVFVFALDRTHIYDVEFLTARKHGASPINLANRPSCREIVCRRTESYRSCSRHSRKSSCRFSLLSSPVNTIRPDVLRGGLDLPTSINSFIREQVVYQKGVYKVSSLGMGIDVSACNGLYSFETIL